MWSHTPHLASRILLSPPVKWEQYAHQLDLPLIAVADLAKLGETNDLYKNLAEIVERNGGIWCAEAEEYLLANAPRL